ncbi:ATP synthase subunit d, mitochondrial [Schistocerca americana]|uniref:ATP synthase subunit d, mitochondrial n=1 Tax=Schistocerca americana TaxID=7009 RepID=UPI001F4F52EA|nr:ATP synthase subunit d, mitochondrial [Schistocerca americana]
MASAARRIRQVSIDWAKMAERVPEDQKSFFVAFKAKSDSYVRRMLANPENPPKIDWTYYKTRVPLKTMVDDFQKQYEALKVPYPADNVTPQIEAQEKEIKKAIEDYIKASNERIANFEAEANKLRSILPFEQMTMEDFRDAFPDQALDPINRPTFWPHNPEEQLGYKASDAVATQESGH